MGLTIPPRNGRRHHPALVLTLGEPHPGGLAQGVRALLRASFGSGAAVASADLGDLRLGGVLGAGSGPPDPYRLESWARTRLEGVLQIHCGSHPGGAVLPVLLVVDGEDPVNRERLLSALQPVRRALASLTLPESLQPRLVALLGWPCAQGGAGDAPSRRWLAVLADEVGARESLDAAFIVSRSGCRAGRGRDPRYLALAERNSWMAEQAVLLLASGVLEEVLSFRRGLERSLWSVLTSGDDAEGDEPWFPAPGEAGLRWLPARGIWSVGGAVSPDVPVVSGDLPDPVRVQCLYGMPLRELAPPSLQEPSPIPAELVP